MPPTEKRSLSVWGWLEGFATRSDRPMGAAISIALGGGDPFPGVIPPHAELCFTSRAWPARSTAHWALRSDYRIEHKVEDSPWRSIICIAAGGNLSNRVAKVEVIFDNGIARGVAWRSPARPHDGVGAPIPWQLHGGKERKRAFDEAPSCRAPQRKGSAQMMDRLRLGK